MDTLTLIPVNTIKSIKFGGDSLEIDYTKKDCLIYDFKKDNVFYNISFYAKRITNRGGCFYFENSIEFANMYSIKKLYNSDINENTDVIAIIEHNNIITISGWNTFEKFQRPLKITEKLMCISGFELIVFSNKSMMLNYLIQKENFKKL